MSKTGKTTDDMRDAEVRQFAVDLNQTWVAGKFDDLLQYFDPAVKMVIPGKKLTVDGVSAMVQSYRDFAAACVLHHFEIVDVQVMPIHPNFVCHLDYSVDYEINGKRCLEMGRDIYIIKRVAGHSYQVVWRTQHEIIDND